jgi:hypothetical protein
VCLLLHILESVDVLGRLPTMSASRRRERRCRWLPALSEPAIL